MSKVTYTPQQQHAMAARGHSLLVSAAAGSGKTAVLVQRVLKYLTEQKGDIRRLMITTFTEAAASELKDKLKRAIEEYLEENGGNDHLMLQSTLIDSAEIGTVHSICNRLILRYFAKLEIDPRCRPIDDTDEQEILGEVIADLLERVYGSKDPAEQRFLQIHSVERDDSKLTELLKSGAKFLERQPLAENYIERTLSFYQTAGKSLFDCFPEDGLYQYILRNLEESAAAYSFAVHRAKSHGGLREFPLYADFLEAEQSNLLAFRSVLEQRDYDRWVEAAAAFTFPRFDWGKLSNKNADPELRELSKNIRNDAKAVAKAFLDGFKRTEQEELALLERQGEQIEVYLRLCREIVRRVQAERHRRGRISYDEMEQLAVGLLVENYDPDTDRVTPTDLALQLRQDYDEIIVDEFQDTNRAQDLIFRALSREERNLFMVGDMKQSIYRFRGAEPEVFDQKRKASVPYTTDQLTQKTVLELNANFRSHRGVLSFANRLFESIMSEELGGVTYDDRERLVAGRRYDEEDQPRAELHWLQPMEDESGVRLSAAEQNARHIAAWIKEQVEGGVETLLPGGGRRPAIYQDYAILLRSAAGVSAVYERALQRLGIPVENRTEGLPFFELPEVQSILAYLMVLNNPYDDVALVSLLYGDYFCFTVGELAAIRHRKRPLYDDLRLAAETDPHARRAYEAIEGYRALAGTLYVYDLLHRIYRESGILAAYTPEAGGAEKCANLELLAENAREFESGGYRGLYAFIQHIRISNSKTQNGARLLSDPNAVRIMTIHSSKGLEFPVCILGDPQRGFDKRDLRKKILLHSRYGAAAEAADPDLFYWQTSRAQEVLISRMLGDQISEEERVLYVAVTRAESKLVVLVNAPEKKMQDWVGNGVLLGTPMPIWLIRSSTACYAEWICTVLAASREGAPLRAQFGYPEREFPPLGVTLRIGQKDVQVETQAAERSVAFDRAAFRARLDWVYPHLSAARLPAKLSVSELKGLREQEPDAEPMLEEGLRLSRPRFTNQFRPAGNEVGNALHQALQFCDFQRLAADPEEELARLVAEGFILEKQRALISVDKIRTFTQSDAFSRLLASDYYCKEERFLFPMQASELFGAEAEGEILIQGVLDCYGVSGKEAFLLDYKTDRVQSEEELIARYRVQMELYAEALRRVKGLKVTRREIYSFSLNRSVIV